jgi:hypothetical protein
METEWRTMGGGYCNKGSSCSNLYDYCTILVNIFKGCVAYHKARGYGRSPLHK